MNEPNLDRFYEKQKEIQGKFATFAWIGVGIYLMITVDSFRFLSWQSAVYFIVGMFVAAILFGSIFYYLQRGFAKILFKTAEPSKGIASIISVAGIVIMALEIAVVFLVAKFVLNLLFES